MSPDKRTNEDLLVAIQSGDDLAFNKLVQRFKNPLISFVFRFLGNTHDAEDVVQDAFVKIYFNINKYNPAYKASTWIYTIVHNLARTAYKRKNRWLVFASSIKSEKDDDDFMETIADESMSPEFFTDSDYQERMLARALDQINPIFKEAVILRDVNGLSYEDIASIMEINIGTVKSKINRGRTLLKQLIREEMRKDQK